jgi:hypothetical protein
MEEVHMSRVERQGKSQSETLFRLLLQNGVKIDEIQSEDFFKVTREFLSQIFCIREANLFAVARENTLYETDGLIANTIVSHALLIPGIFTRDELHTINNWISDKRFQTMLAHMMFWSAGTAMRMAEYEMAEVALPQQAEGRVKADEFQIDQFSRMVAKTSEAICEVVCTNYTSQCYAANDVFGNLAKLKRGRQQIREFEQVRRRQYYIELFIRLVSSRPHKSLIADGLNRFDKPLREYTDDDIDALLAVQPQSRYALKLSDLEKGEIRKLFKSERSLLVLCHESMAQLTIDIQRNINRRAAEDIREILTAFDATFDCDDVPLPSWRSRPFVSFIYNHYFQTGNDTIFSNFDREGIIKYFKVLLKTLHDLKSKDISASVKEVINDTFAGADSSVMKRLLKKIPGSRIGDLYLTLLAFVDSCSTLEEIAEKLADKFISANDKFQSINTASKKSASALEAILADEEQRLQAEPEWEQQSEGFYTSADERRARIEIDLDAQKSLCEDEFLASCTIRQMLINGEVFRQQFGFEDQIRSHYCHFIVQSAAAPNHRVIQQLRIKKIKMETGGLLDETAQHRLGVVKTLIEAHDGFIKQQWQEYLGCEARVLSSYQSDDLYLRLYEREIALIKAQHGKSIAAAEDSPHKAVLVRQADEYQRTKIDEAKRRFHFNHWSGTQSSTSSLLHLAPGAKVDCDSTQATAMYLITYYDLANRSVTETVDDRRYCTRKQSEHYKRTGSLVEKTKQTNFKKIDRIIANYDRFKKRELQTKRRKILKRRWKIAKYAGYVLLGLVGVGAIAAATVATMGLIHLAWIVPAAYFTVGGALVVGSGVGAVCVDKSRRQGIRGWFRNRFRSNARSPEVQLAPAEQHDADGIIDREIERIAREKLEQEQRERFEQEVAATQELMAATRQKESETHDPANHSRGNGAHSALAYHSETQLVEDPDAGPYNFAPALKVVKKREELSGDFYRGKDRPHSSLGFSRSLFQPIADENEDDALATVTNALW